MSANCENTQQSDRDMCQISAEFSIHKRCLKLLALYSSCTQRITASAFLQFLGHPLKLSIYVQSHILFSFYVNALCRVTCGGISIYLVQMTCTILIAISSLWSYQAENFTFTIDEGSVYTCSESYECNLYDPVNQISISSQLPSGVHSASSR